MEEEDDDDCTFFPGWAVEKRKNGRLGSLVSS